MVFDLMEMQAELSPPHAPDLTMRMAGMARRLPELEEDPVAFYARAQELFETRGDLDNAQLAADERLAVMLDRAYAADAVAAAYLEFARISEALGDLDLALREQTGLAVSIADESLNCVALGTGKALEYEKQLRHAIDYDS